MILVHGLYSNGLIWLWSKKSLGFNLVDAGLIFQARGTTSSLGHTTLSTKSIVYWSFSWHEIDYYDIPAAILYKNRYIMLDIPKDVICFDGVEVVKDVLF